MGYVFHDGKLTMAETVKWMTPMESPRRIGLETTWKGVLIVV